MEFKNNDVILVLNIKDKKGRKIRVSGIKDIKVRVWTQRPDCALTFYYDDIIQKSAQDIIIIRGEVMEALPTGVVTYSYSYKIMDKVCDCDCEGCESVHSIKKSEEVITDIYWTNINYDKVVNSPAYFIPMEYMKDLVEKEKDERVKGDDELVKMITDEVNPKLDDEIVRATTRENELDGKIEDETTRATNKENELDSKLEDETTRATNKENEIQGKLDSEVSRATAKETYIDDKLDSEISRATTKEDILDGKIEDETTRATTKENEIQGKLDSEISRATNKENELDSKLEDETTRATTKENEIQGKLNDETTRATTKENEIQGKLDSETSRATNKENELDGKIKTVNDSLDGFKEEVKTEQDNQNTLIDGLTNDVTNIKSKYVYNIYPSLETNTLDYDYKFGEGSGSSSINLKTINGNTILGSGNINIEVPEIPTFKTINNQEITGSGNINIEVPEIPTFKTINGEEITGTGDIKIQGGSDLPLYKSGETNLRNESSTIGENSYDCIAFGTECTCDGERAAAFGSNTRSSGLGSFATGVSGVATGWSSFVTGEGNTANNKCEFTCGFLSINKTDENPTKEFGNSGSTLFTIGNGDINPDTYEGIRHNALEIRETGEIYISDVKGAGEFYEKPMINLQDKLKELEKAGSIQGVKTDGNVVAIGEDNQIHFNDVEYDGVTYVKQPSLVVGVGHKISADYNTAPIALFGHYSNDYSNAADLNNPYGKPQNTLFAVGCGTSDTDRQNAFTITGDGLVYVKRSDENRNVSVTGVAMAYDDGKIITSSNLEEHLTNYLSSNLEKHLTDYLKKSEFNDNFNMYLSMNEDVVKKNNDGDIVIPKHYGYEKTVVKCGENVVFGVDNYNNNQHLYIFSPNSSNGWFDLTQYLLDNGIM